MDMQKLTKFFMWCTVINGALLVFAVAGCTLGPDFGFSLQSNLFHIPRESLNVAIYMFLGLFKIAWLVFNVVPYVALLIIGKK
jgi:Family of unknown function (DUF6868)